jgi:NAD(P)H dehydrogenase (quinone)
MVSLQGGCRVVVACHSGYGHTLRVAQAVCEGVAAQPGARASLLDVARMDAGGWAALDDADAIIFGAPTYMGGASGVFKTFADESAKAWFAQRWKDKVAGGFTCSMAMSGDKFSTLMYFVTLAMQHGMIWVGTGTMPSVVAGDPASQNRVGSYLGVMAQADNLPPDQTPPVGDLDTARAYGKRIAQAAAGRKST